MITVKISLEETIQLAVNYILSLQTEKGYWSDFKLFCGNSDEWITGYIGNVLLVTRNSSPQSTFRERVDAALQRASHRILHYRHYVSGWGYNAVTGVDTDSTSTCFMFLKRMNMLSLSQINASINTILQSQNDDRGFGAFSQTSLAYESGRKNPEFASRDISLYGGWKSSEPYVSAIATLALIESGICKDSESVKKALNYIISYQNQEGYWDCYWSTSKMIGTFYCVSLLAQLGIAQDLIKKAERWIETQRYYQGWGNEILKHATSIDTALAVLTFIKTGNQLFHIDEAVHWLCDSQCMDGSWIPYEIMRVPPSWMKKPWDSRLKIRTALDQNRLYTTATIIWALAEYRELVKGQENGRFGI